RRPPDRLEINPPGHLVAARPHPDPPAGPRPAAAGPPSRPVLAAGRRSPVRLGGVRARGRGHVRAAAGRAGLVRARPADVPRLAAPRPRAPPHRPRPAGRHPTPPLPALSPPVRPRGHLEVRGIDAQPGDGWMVPLAVTAALLDDPVAAEQAMAAAEALWHRPGSPWWLAARHGPAHPAIAAASRRCFAGAEGALARAGEPAALRRAVTAFAERYVSRDRCPADDLLDQPGTNTLPEDLDGQHAQA